MTVTIEQKLKALSLFDLGWGYRRIARELSLSFRTVENWSMFYRGRMFDFFYGRPVPVDLKKLEKAVLEHINEDVGFRVLTVKYGIPFHVIHDAYKKYLKLGRIELPKKVKAIMPYVSDCHEQLHQQVEALNAGDLSREEIKELKELLIVNIALLEVLEKSASQASKKKEYRRQRLQLEVRLASVERANFCK